MRLGMNVNRDVATIRSAINRGQDVVFFDLETTGLSCYKDRILSFSALKARKQSGVLKEIDRINVYINPLIPIPAAVSRINGITDDFISRFESENVVLPVIFDWLGEAPIIAGYNSKSFDERFMNEAYTRVFNRKFEYTHHVDVYHMAKQMMLLKSYKLIDVCKELGTGIGIDFHKSMDDVIATFRCFTLLMEMYDVEPVQRGREVGITGASYWEGPAHWLRRIYVQTRPYLKVYYDVYRKEWFCDDDRVDLSSIRKNVLRLYEADDEKELLRMLKDA